jgi:hypothetical protein
MKPYLFSTFILLASLVLLAATSPIPNSHPVHIESRGGLGTIFSNFVKSVGNRLKFPVGSVHWVKGTVSNKSSFISAILIYPTSWIVASAGP